MGTKTKIEWADSSINPIMGCTGCALRESHCYAATLCARYAGRKGWPRSFDEPEFFPGRLEKAVKWSDLTGKSRPNKPWFNGLPRHIFVNDMSDGFCPDVDPWQWLAPSIPSMHPSPHIWLLLTKWPDRMRQFFEEWNKPIPSNILLGVTAENQQRADERIPVLLQIPAAGHFVSLEPLLGEINLEPYLPCPTCSATGFAPKGGPYWHPEYKCRDCNGDPSLSLVIAGGESGSGARPCHPDWVRAVRDQCQEARVPFFFKHWGEWVPWTSDIFIASVEGNLRISMYADLHVDGHTTRMARVGKKRAGRLLDGREWNECPDAMAAEALA